MDNICFIVGSPRSGTTIISEILGRHPDIAQIYEPYFIWERYTGTGNDDIRTSEQATPEISDYISKEFDRFLIKSRKKVLIEKTPVNSFRIPFIYKIFPNARWIHIIRDGRDATVSINREWLRRKKLAENKNIRDIISIVWVMLSRQPFWRNRLQAIKFEIIQRLGNSEHKYFNKAKWQGQIGWGPRFPGWHETLKNTDDLISFNALQWLYCVESVENGFNELLDKNKTLEIRYENFAQNPDKVLRQIFQFLNLPNTEGIATDVSISSIGQWRSLLNQHQKEIVHNVIGNKLIELGYENNNFWNDN